MLNREALQNHTFDKSLRMEVSLLYLTFGFLILAQFFMVSKGWQSVFKWVLLLGERGRGGSLVILRWCGCLGGGWGEMGKAMVTSENPRQSVENRPTAQNVVRLLLSSPKSSRQPDQKSRFGKRFKIMRTLLAALTVALQGSKCD